MESNHTVKTNVRHLSKSNSAKSPVKFTQKNVELAQTPLFFPEGFEKLFLAMYFVTLPYVAGIFFLFFYVSGGSFETFSSLNQNQAFILTWAIGYEIIASLVLLWIFKMAVIYANESRKPGIQQQFRIP
ncbi:MAG TPA: hypothetical protein VIN02_04415 [Sulfurovum sp.]